MRAAAGAGILQCILLTFCDATVRRQHRSDWESPPLAECALCGLFHRSNAANVCFVQRWR